MCQILLQYAHDDLTFGGVDEAAVVVDDAGAHHALRPVAVEHHGRLRQVGCH